MGTNYTRVPKTSDIIIKIQKLNIRLDEMDFASPSQASDAFRFIEHGWERLSPWDEFIDGVNVHLGKRSSGWKFLWNWNNGDYYKTKEELLSFIRRGRVVNEYGELQDTEEFIQMALDWGEPDGLVADKEYFDTTNHHHWMSNPEDYYDIVVDGLRVSTSTDFS